MVFTLLEGSCQLHNTMSYCLTVLLLLLIFGLQILGFYLQSIYLLPAFIDVYLCRIVDGHRQTFSDQCFSISRRPCEAR